MEKQSKNMLMKKISIILGLTCVTICCLKAQTDYKKAYTLFDAQGKEISYNELIQGLAAPEVVFIGEIHNCVITHWLELEITRSLYSLHGDSLTLGAEMFEADNQLIMDEYMQRTISYERFEAEARLWPNYSTDYQPVVFFAKEHHIPFVATNVPRRYANVVKNKGLEYLDSLSDEAKRYLPPLPLWFDTQQQQVGMFGMMHALGRGESQPEFLAQAQAVKDATMGWFIAKNLRYKFLHFNGNFHSDRQGGIIPYLLRYRPGTTLKTICAVRQEDISQLEKEHIGRADYYICVPQDMSTSY